MIKLEKNVPAPESRQGSPKYPFAQMEVGDSFFAEIKLTSMSSCLTLWRKKTGFAFVVAAENSGVRVWRTK